MKSSEKVILVEVANLTRAGSVFTKPYRVTTEDSKIASSGCSGVGLERLLVVFVAYHGLDPKNWPSQVRALWQKL